MKSLLNYTLGSGAIANPDGSSPAQMTGCAATAGPGATPLGTFPQALDFGSGGRVQVTLPAIPTLPKFCFRLLLKAGPVDSRQSVLSCSGLPVRLSLDKSPDSTHVVLSAGAQNASSGWTSITASLAVDRWAIVDIAYDMDTLALFVDEQVSAVTAFQTVQLAKSGDPRLTLGGPPAGVREQFLGQMAALQLTEDIPAHLENALDARRSSPQWHISLKRDQLGSSAALGAPTGNLRKDEPSGFFTQRYQKGIIFFDPADGQSAAMHGVIYELWRSQPALQTQLGGLLRDEMDATMAGTRKSVFENGAIFWSAATGAVPMVGQKMMADYIKLGEAKHPAGLPKSAATAVTGGLRQELQNGVLYFNTKGQVAFALHGAIAKKYLAAGGHAKWGQPVTDVSEVVTTGGKAKQRLGYTVELENGASIFSSSTGTEAFLLDGAFRDAYLQSGGLKGALGAPTSNVETISPGIRHAAFENGAIAQVGAKPPVVIRPFTIFIARVDTQESEAGGRGENDLYMHFRVQSSGHEVYHKRFPESGDVGGRNVAEPKLRTPPFDPADPHLKLSLELDVWESDGLLNDDDHIGIFKKDLSIKNLWGLLEERDGVFKSGKVSQINQIDWSVSPEVTDATPFDFWNTRNHSTPSISKEQYAAAFRDVDSEPEWYWAPDGLRKLYYDLAVEGIAKTGNCFGMSTEAIYAWKDLSIFGRPLSGFTEFASIKNEVNIKQCYQLGAEPILWFSRQLVSFNTRNPKNVFQETREFFKAGLNPVLCVASDWKFSSAHCLMPIAWDASKTPWEITVFDPNKNNQTQTVFVDPETNTFNYLNKYKGGAGIGQIKAGHLHYMPWSVLCRAPVTPVGALLDLGMSLVIGASAATSTLTDAAGKNLFANLDANEMADGLAEKFIAIPGWGGEGSLLDGELLIRPTMPGSKLGRDFTHGLRGLRDGALDYGLRWKRQALQLRSTIEKSEHNSVRMHQLGSTEQLAAFRAPKDRLLRLTTEQRLGEGKDFKRVDISRIPVKAGVEAQLGIQPGGASVDIVAGPDAVDAQVDISGSIAGRAFKHSYDARLEGGTRLIFSHENSSSSVKVGKIDQVLGSLRDPRLIFKK